MHTEQSSGQRRMTGNKAGSSCILHILAILYSLKSHLDPVMKANPLCALSNAPGKEGWLGTALGVAVANPAHTGSIQIS